MEILVRKSTKRCTERDGQRPTFPITTITSTDKKKKKKNWKSKIREIYQGGNDRIEVVARKIDGKF